MRWCSGGGARNVSRPLKDCLLGEAEDWVNSSRSAWRCLGRCPAPTDETSSNDSTLDRLAIVVCDSVPTRAKLAALRSTIRAPRLRRLDRSRGWTPGVGLLT